MRERLKHQFYLVEYLPLTLEAALARDFHGVRPPFQWVIAVLSDVRACVRWSLWLCMRRLCAPRDLVGRECVVPCYARRVMVAV